MTKLLQKKSWKRSPSQQGWLGVDFGTEATKVVQLARSGASWDVVFHAWIDRGSSGTTVNQEGNGKYPVGPLSIDVCQGGTIPAAAVTSMSCLGMEVEAVQEGSVALSDCSARLVPTCNLQHASTPKRVSMDPDLASWIGQQLRSKKLEPRLLDAPPWTLARAVALVSPTGGSEAEAILDWSCQDPLLVVQQAGLPQYVRKLQGSGLLALTEAIRNKWSLTLTEALFYLRKLDMAQPIGERGDRTPDTLHSCLQPVLQLLYEDIRKSFQFIKWHSPDITPKRIWIAGGGGLIPYLINSLQNEFDQPVGSWSMPIQCDAPRDTKRGASSERLTSLYAQAAALSVLEWIR